MIPTQIKNLGYVIAAILGIKYDMLVAFTLLVFIDLFTGIMASVVTRGWVSFKSSTMARGIVVKSLYVVILLVIAELGVTLEQDMTLFIKSSLGILAVSESYSILANIYMIKTKKVVEEIDALTPIMRKVKDLYDVLAGRDR